MNLEVADYNQKRRDSFVDYWKNAEDKILYNGFECIKEYLGITLGSCIDMTGFSHSGKTEFAMELMFYNSEIFGGRHALYVPDMGGYNEIRRKLIHKHTGKTFKKGYANTIQEHEIIKAENWIDHHFIILKKKDIRKPVTPFELWEFVVTFKDEVGGLSMGLIDSWKNMFHDMQGKREDQFLDYALSFRNEMAEEYNKTFLTIAHPTKTELEDEYNSTGNKKRRIPDANDIKGGQSWFANGKIVMTVDRPDKLDNQTDIYISKVKPDMLGKAGVIKGKLKFDWAKSRYYEEYNGQKFYAGELKKYLDVEHPLGLPQTSYYEPPEKDDNPF